MLGKHRKSYVFDVQLTLKTIKVVEKTPADLSFEISVGRSILPRESPDDGFVLLGVIDGTAYIPPPT